MKVFLHANEMLGSLAQHSTAADQIPRRRFREFKSSAEGNWRMSSVLGIKKHRRHGISSGLKMKAIVRLVSLTVVWICVMPLATASTPARNLKGSENLMV